LTPYFGESFNVDGLCRIYANLRRMALQQLFSESQTPTEVINAIIGVGPVSWKDLHRSDRGPLGVGKLRLAGVYDDRFEDTFMLRTRIPGGRLSADQLEVIAKVVHDFSVKDEGSSEPERFAEITTRQNFQIHWIRFQSLGEIWRRFHEVGLGTLEACGNSLRNVTACPVDGIDPSAHFDVAPVIDELEAFTRDDERLTAFLPRKFKVGVTACATDCVVARVNCLAFTPARHGLGFNVHLGGGLSDYPRLATPADLFVEPAKATAVVKAALEVFVAFGDFQNSSINRFRALVHELGPDRTETEIRARLPFDADTAGDDLSTWATEDHVGIHPDRKGTNYVGLCVPLGRLSAEEMTEIARLARTYGDGNVRLTLRQNLILTGVRNVDGLLAEPLLSRLRPDPDPFERGVIACTSAPFCKFAILAMKPYGAALIDHLRSNVPPQGWERLEGLRIHMSGCKASCAQIPLAHVGVRATMGKNEATHFDAFDIAVGGDAGAGHLARWVRGEVPAAAAFEGINRLLTSVAVGESDLSNLGGAAEFWSAGTRPISN
jgi:ferredoxin-nitrite reductase